MKKGVRDAREGQKGEPAPAGGTVASRFLPTRKVPTPSYPWACHAHRDGLLHHTEPHDQVVESPTSPPSRDTLPYPGHLFSRFRSFGGDGGAARPFHEGIPTPM